MEDRDRENRIRERAHQIWEREGGGEGNQERHWEQATREIDAENAAAGEGDDGKTGSTGSASGLQRGRNLARRWAGIRRRQHGGTKEEWKRRARSELIHLKDADKPERPSGRML
ncbi:DUF2934 domain-containing protein [Rhizobium laguerreae]|uniref:DUF2934 domain-containing protein n=2 Tax=Rhizobium laguerreae TaxID=1076926 RepID=UPI001C919EA6|nr:DUF2934 domain-containing protein [Rhizobium laguerreae]MBY3558532.1 DUF2934 domain-containing protein [Rhizobium laguerreae]